MGLTRHDLYVRITAIAGSLLALWLGRRSRWAAAVGLLLYGGYACVFLTDALFIRLGRWVGGEGPASVLALALPWVIAAGLLVAFLGLRRPRP